MLFNSYGFLFAFLPVTFAGYYLLGHRYGTRVALGFLTVASLVFYGQWNARYIPLLLASLAVNFVIGDALSKGDAHAPRARQRLLLGGLIFDLGLLGYYKYAGFFVEVAGDALGRSFQLSEIILPLAISFFTFQQIGFLVDAYRGQTPRYRFTDYAFLILFFPHFIAGPIVRHSELMPQISTRSARLQLDNVAVGVTQLVFGLFKKVVIADHLSLLVTPAYASLTQGDALSAPMAWLVVVAYALQLYFDFSGYSDMALGLARMFNFHFPYNFDSPYRAANIIDFWRRWHVSLSRFLRDYLYIPLGGNRGGELLRARNLLITMLLGGLWHGAGFGFVLWGGIHGLLLLVNHAHQQLRGRGAAARAKEASSRGPSGVFYPWLASLSTFVCVALAWIPFRAPDLATAQRLFLSLWQTTDTAQLRELLSTHGAYVSLVLGAYLIARLAPNTQQILTGVQPALDAQPAPARIAWQPTPVWAFTVAVLGASSLLCLTQVSEFLYFQF